MTIETFTKSKQYKQMWDYNEIVKKVSQVIQTCDPEFNSQLHNSWAKAFCVCVNGF